MRFTSRPVDPIDDPLGRAPDLVWMSPEVSLWGWGEAARFRPGTGPGRIRHLSALFSSFLEDGTVVDEMGVPGSGPVLFASITFSPDSAGSIGIVPRVTLGRRGETWWITTVEEERLPEAADTPDGVDRARYAGSSVPDVQWLEKVARAVDEIRSGALDKVVLARDYAVWSKTPFRPSPLLAHLHQRFPACHVFRVADLIGASPELLVRRTATRLDSLVLAGSAPTYHDPGQDADAAAALLASDKDRWEHELAVRSVRESLEAVKAESSVGDVPEILRLDNVQHLATPVTATVAADLTALDLAEAFHPTAAVGGTPTGRAVALIDELEGMDRGRYAGPVGWMDADGDGELAIALRCAELSGARARLFAGAGIVSASLPEEELDETRLKLDAMMGALASG